MWQLLKSVFGMHVPAQLGDSISPLIDRSALADFVRLLQEADAETAVVDVTSEKCQANVIERCP